MSTELTYSNHEGHVLKVAAQDLQLGSGRGQNRFFDCLHQHVQDPQLLLLFLIDEDQVRCGQVERPDRRTLGSHLVQELDVLHLGRPDVLHGVQWGSGDDQTFVKYVKKFISNGR